MPQLVTAPRIIEAVGTPSKTIQEFVGRVASGTAQVSVARMISPSGWSEPGQTPEFDEYTVVLRGTLHVSTREGELDVQAGQAIVTPNIIRSELIALAREWEEAGLVEGLDQFVADLIVERDQGNPNRVNALVPPDIVNQFRSFAAAIQFRL